MKTITLAFLLFLPFTLLSQSVKYSADKDAEWKSYKTFSVGEGEVVTVLKEDIDKEKLLHEMRQTIVSEMEARGFTLAQDAADLRISFTAELMETTTVEEVGPLGQTPADEPVDMEQSRTWSQNRRQGSMAIDISENKSDKSIWRSSVTIDFGGDDLLVIFNSAIGRSFRKLPVKK